MKKIISFLMTCICFACNSTIDKIVIKQQIIDTEKQFEQMTAEKGIASAFTFFADDSAVIKRQKDTLIKGKQQIFNFYKPMNSVKVTVKWKPDFVEISGDGSLAYTYGRYIWIERRDSIIKEYNGVFHTVWKRQKDNSWKYVWD